MDKAALGEKAEILAQRLDLITERVWELIQMPTVIAASTLMDPVPCTLSDLPFSIRDAVKKMR